MNAILARVNTATTCVPGGSFFLTAVMCRRCEIFTFPVAREHRRSSVPGALPWADLCQPFGLKSRQCHLDAIVQFLSQFAWGRVKRAPPMNLPKKFSVTSVARKRLNGHTNVSGTVILGFLVGTAAGPEGRLQAEALRNAIHPSLTPVGLTSVRTAT